MKFYNKVVLITGSGSGIGAATALLFAKEGANVVIVDKHEEGAKNTGTKCEEFGKRVLVITADISKDEEIKEIVKKTINSFGKLDVLVNNAGILKGGSILNGTVMENFDEIMNINLRAMVLLTSSFAKYLVESKGCIVNISSAAAVSAKAAGPFPAYALSKAGVNAFTQVSALEFASADVRVNAIIPGPVKTNIAAAMMVSGLDSLEEYLRGLDLRKIADPEEIADLIVYLSSEKAKSITGSCYVIDNGLLHKSSI